jgi:hypothetical protein
MQHGSGLRLPRRCSCAKCYQFCSGPSTSQPQLCCCIHWRKLCRSPQARSKREEGTAARTRLARRRLQAPPNPRRGSGLRGLASHAARDHLPAPASRAHAGTSHPLGVGGPPVPHPPRSDTGVRSKRPAPAPPSLAPAASTRAGARATGLATATRLRSLSRSCCTPPAHPCSLRSRAAREARAVAAPRCYCSAHLIAAYAPPTSRLLTGRCSSLTR